MKTLIEYYDRLAGEYDRDRFGNTYGRFLDSLERKLLDSGLSRTPPAEVIDLGCGTGRLLGYAMAGVDASREMLKVAAGKFPDRRLMQAGLEDLDPALHGKYRAAICFHVFMHLDPSLIRRSFQAIAGVVQTGGRFIFDIPSRHRRALNRRRPSETGWHGETAATWADIEAWAGPGWRVVRRRGLLFLPVHRLPHRMRSWFRGLDYLVGMTPLARMSSYHVYELERL